VQAFTAWASMPDLTARGLRRRASGRVPPGSVSEDLAPSQERKRRSRHFSPGPISTVGGRCYGPPFVAAAPIRGPLLPRGPASGGRS
jgi:hypothetical protein